MFIEYAQSDNWLNQEDMQLNKELFDKNYQEYYEKHERKTNMKKSFGLAKQDYEKEKGIIAFEEDEENQKGKIPT